MRSFLTLSVSATALCAAAPTYAQDAEPSADADATTDVIVVRGQRLANQRAIDAKREAEIIADILAADDLGNLPDQNLAEAISRVPGATTFQDEGAGLYIGLRGLNQEFVNVQLDGLDFSSASRTFDQNLRGTNLEAIASSFVSRVEVIKSVTPDLDGDSIAGTVNLVTRSAFDSPAGYRIGLQAGQYELDVADDDVGLSYEGNAAISHIFGDNDQFGLVIDANFRDVERDNFKPDAFFGSAADPANMPVEIGGFFYQRREESYGLTGKLEFRSGDRFSGFVTAAWFDSEIDLDKNKHALYTPSGSNDAVTGAFDRVSAQVRTDRVRYGVQDSLTLTAGGDFTFDDGSELNIRATTSSSLSFQDDPRFDWLQWRTLSGTYDYNGQFYTYELDAPSAAAFADPDQYFFNGFRRYQEEGDETVSEARIDYARSRDGQGWGFQVGGGWSEQTYDFTASFIRLRNYSGSENFNQFLFTDDWLFPGTSNPVAVLSDVTAGQALIDTIPESDFGRISRIIDGNDFKFDQSVLAAYGLAEYTTERMNLIFGARFEQTEFEGQSRLNRADGAAFETRSGDYGDLLPSVAFNYQLNNDWVLRLGASRTVGRPDIRDIASGETIPNETTGVFSRGNPDLEARRSDNFDASLEYYFDQGDSLFSVAVFHKSIQDEIFTLQTPYVFTRDDGTQVNSFFFQPDNAGDATITGIEFGLIKDRLDFLPGPLANLGASANVTFNDGEIDLVDDTGATVRSVSPEGLAEQVANLSVFYEGERLSARLAYRYASEQVQSLSLDGSGDLRLADYSQVDGQIGYQITDSIEVFGEVWNLFEDRQEFTNENLVAGAPNWFEHVEYGRAIWIGVNIKH